MDEEGSLPADRTSMASTHSGSESDSHRGTFTTVTAEPATPMDVKVVTNVVLRPIMMLAYSAADAMYRVRKAVLPLQLGTPPLPLS